jgi:hypothetical protein
VGQPFSSAIAIVAKELQDPLATEFGMIADEAAYGRDMGEALKDMAERLDMQDLRFLAVAVTIQQQSGGNLAEILAGLGKVIRARFRLFRKVDAITVGGEMVGQVPVGLPDRRAGGDEPAQARLLRRIHEPSDVPAGGGHRGCVSHRQYRGDAGADEYQGVRARRWHFSTL